MGDTAKDQGKREGSRDISRAMPKEGRLGDSRL